MKAIPFPEHTMVYAGRQAQYRQLPAHRSNEPEGRVTFCWKLSWRERLAVLLTGTLWHQVLTFQNPLQPQLLTIDKPAMKMHLLRAGDDLDDPPGCPHCGAMAGCCDKYPDCPMGIQVDAQKNAAP